MEISSTAHIFHRAEYVVIDRKVREEFSWSQLGEESQACGAALMAAQTR